TPPRSQHCGRERFAANHSRPLHRADIIEHSGFRSLRKRKSVQWPARYYTCGYEYTLETGCAQLPAFPLTLIPLERPVFRKRREGRGVQRMSKDFPLWGSMREMWWWRRGWRGCGRGWTKILLIEFRGCSIDHSFHGVPEIFLVNLFGNVVPHLLFGFDIFSYQFID